MFHRLNASPWMKSGVHLGLYTKDTNVDGQKSPK